MPFWSTSSLRSQRQPVEALLEMSHRFGVDTGTIYVSTKLAFVSIQ